MMSTATWKWATLNKNESIIGKRPAEEDARIKQRNMRCEHE